MIHVHTLLVTFSIPQLFSTDSVRMSFVNVEILLVVTGADIPGGATLIFDVELLEIKDAPKQENIFKIIDADEDKHLSSDEVRFCDGASALF